MSDSLYIASTGMHVQQGQINVISNNLANVNTPAYKKSSASFSDLMYREINKTTSMSSNTHEIGSGAAITGTSKTFTQGEVKATERALDIAINGDGFFEVNLLDGSKAYTRNGSLNVSSESLLTTNDGFELSPPIQIPEDATDIVITTDGRVQAAIPSEDGLIDIGQIELVNFVSTEHLKPVGNNLYLPTNDSGDGLIGKPGEDNLGVLAQGFLESSNVNLINELTDLILAQRAYEINSKVVQISDELLSLSNNMRR
ncbi:MAG: flagellar basal-body rod protein FlgG [Gammaproteobacteria bacterium]|nr:flagellar basal-body rod protein FlgG [Gammaproteobacteria bacterium]